jgi:hypothetical protein
MWKSERLKERRNAKEKKQARTHGHRKYEPDMHLTMYFLQSYELIAGLSPWGITLHDVTCYNSHFCCTPRASNPAARNKEHSWARELLRSPFKYSSRLVWAMDRSVVLAHCDIWSGQPWCHVVHLPNAPNCTSVKLCLTVHLKKGDKNRKARKLW